MRIRKVAVAGMFTLLAGCANGGDPTPPPTTPPPAPTPFSAIATYHAYATLEKPHTQRIDVEVGRPETLPPGAARTLGCTTGAAGDLMVAVRIKVTNTSPKDSVTTNIGVSAALAVNPGSLGTITPYFFVSSGGACYDQNPLYGTSETAFLFAERPALSWHHYLPQTHTGSNLEYLWYYVISGGAIRKTVTLAHTFLTLNVLDAHEPEVRYHITKVTATNSIVGMEGNGSSDRMFYIPLLAKSSPCEQLNKLPAAMGCGIHMEVPEE